VQLGEGEEQATDGIDEVERRWRDGLEIVDGGNMLTRRKYELRDSSMAGPLGCRAYQQCPPLAGQLNNVHRALALDCPLVVFPAEL
jgi:hypothetical protein